MMEFYLKDGNVLDHQRALDLARAAYKSQGAPHAFRCGDDDGVIHYINSVDDYIDDVPYKTFLIIDSLKNVNVLTVATEHIMAPEAPKAGAAEVSYSKRSRQEVKALMRGELKEHGFMNFGLNDKITVVWCKPSESSFIYLSVANASDKDSPKRETGVRLAYKRLCDGESITVPCPENRSPENVIQSMFTLFNDAAGSKLANEYRRELSSIHDKYTKRGLQFLF